MGWVPEVGDWVLLGHSGNQHVVRVLERRYDPEDDRFEIYVHNGRTEGWCTLRYAEPFDLHDPETLEGWLAS